MTPFREILASAVSIHGMVELESRMVLPKPENGLRSMPDSEYLSLMSRRIFRAGLKHSMVDAKWPAFEEVFFDFDKEQIRLMSDDALDELMRDRRIIRHWGKLKAVRSNAQAMFDWSQETGCFGACIAEWPLAKIVGLWFELQSRFSQLGGNSAAYFLRMSGKDTFLLTNDVIRALNRWGAYDGIPGSRKARDSVQESFNIWQQESNRPLCQISLILALSLS